MYRNSSNKDPRAFGSNKVWVSRYGLVVSRFGLVVSRLIGLMVSRFVLVVRRSVGKQADSVFFLFKSSV